MPRVSTESDGKTPSLTATAAVLAAAFAVFGSFAGSATAGDWPQFRGLNRSGASAETDLLHNWPESGPAELWRISIGEGYSATSVVGDRLYTMYAGEEDGKPVEFAAAFEAGTGQEIWKTVIGDKLDTEFGNGPRSTPTVADGTVYVLGSHGDLAALASGDGSLALALGPGSPW